MAISNFWRLPSAAIVTLAVAFPTPVSSQSVTDLHWLEGSWAGEGSNDELAGLVRVTWSKEIRGSMARVFSWDMPESDHLHYAFGTVGRDDGRLFYRFIHYQPSFETIEPAPFEYHATDVRENFAKFVCVSGCAANFTLERDRDDVLWERYFPVDENGAQAEEPNLVLRLEQQ